VVGASSSATRHRMIRLLVLALWLPALAGCASSAAKLGLTGAPLTAVPEEPSDADVSLPGIQPGAGTYTPSLVPSTGRGRYYGYSE